MREYQSDQKAFLHELGHFVDMNNSYCSESYQFYRIYQEESRKLKADNYAKTSSKEYFAEGFKEYCKDPGNLQNKCPKTHQYINNLIQKM